MTHLFDFKTCTKKTKQKKSYCEPLFLQHTCVVLRTLERGFLRWEVYGGVLPAASAAVMQACTGRMYIKGLKRASGPPFQNLPFYCNILQRDIGYSSNNNDIQEILQIFY